MAKYNHMFDVAFAFDSDHDYDEVTMSELLRALKLRIFKIELEYWCGDNCTEAFGHVETVDMEEDG